MVKPSKLQRQKKLGHNKSRGKPQQRGGGGCRCTVLNCLACICVLVNVFAFSLAILLNQRLKQQLEATEEGTTQIPGQTQAQQQQASLRAGASNTAETTDNPKQQKVVAAAAYAPSIPATQTFHFVFTTDCKDPTQDWQAYTLFHSFYKSRQQGDMTRIVTGCGDSNSIRRKMLEGAHKQDVEPMGLHDPLDENKVLPTSRFHIHFAPFHPQQEGLGGLRKVTKYFNRPHGILHWMEQILGYSATIDSRMDDDVIVVTMDTDMLVLRPFDMDFSQQQEMWQNEHMTPDQFIVRQGQPMAQHAMFPSTWWNEVDVNKAPAEIQPGLRKLQSMSRAEIELNYAAAPPFLVAAKDFYPLVVAWSNYAYPMYQALGEKIMREPHGVYTLAAAERQRPHQLSKTFMVHNCRDLGLDIFSSVLAGDGGSAIVNPPSCRNFPPQLKPHVLQYSKRYALGDYTIGKHYVPHDFVGKMPDSCQKPLFVDPPDNIAQQVNYYYDPEIQTRVEIQLPKYVHNTAFMLCEIIQAFNEASIYLKQNQCSKTGVKVNMEKTLSFKS